MLIIINITTSEENHWQSTSQKEQRHHTGTDYWLIRPISNPDNTTQELPLSLAVTDERSNCRSTRKKSNNCGDQPTPHLQTHNCRPMPGTSRVSGRSTLK
ncbi:hypothetical protein Taro_002219 [Colocasia esculenta]|uniref:Uncharacterized protein n=1 Tax=Colocasia esculenta TaxID=4460 RepID=A0A843TKB2_COLES|nr:hypothetical protein [Colocasia esculenta]